MLFFSSYSLAVQYCSLAVNDRPTVPLFYYFFYDNVNVPYNIFFTGQIADASLEDRPTLDYFELA